MTARFVIAGTDTGVGKTVFAAALTAALDGTYWKPIQCGLDGGGDRERVRTLSGLPASRILDEAYRLQMPASPHIAAAQESVAIDENRLTPPPQTDRPLIIEGAGGLMVPITDKLLQVDLFARWQIPVILVARTALGTINHSLLSIEALNKRAVPIHGVAFVGEGNPEVQRTIVGMGRVHNIGRLSPVDPLNKTTLAEAFRNGFSVRDFA